MRKIEGFRKGANDDTYDGLACVRESLGDGCIVRIKGTPEQMQSTRFGGPAKRAKP